MNKPSAERWWGIGSLVSALILLAAILAVGGCATRLAEPVKQAKAEREAWSLLLDQLGYEQMDIWLNQAKRLPLGAYAEAPPRDREAIWWLIKREDAPGAGKLTVDDVVKLQEAWR